MALSNKYIKEDLQRLVEDLEETVLRLHVNARDWEERYDQFKKSRNLAKKGIINFKKVDDTLRDELEHSRLYTFYKGKIMAYMYVLEELGSEVPQIINRLRGVKKKDDNSVIESKMHYTERKGHFASDDFKNWKKQL